MTSSSATMAINAYIFFCCILFFSLHASKSFVNGAGMVRRSASRSPYSSFSGNGTKSSATPPGAIDSLLGQQPNGSLYSVTVGVGTPVKQFSLILDTGSDITWVRCSPKQQEYYNPSSSSTSSKVPCNGPECDRVQNYMDKSFAQGYFVRDRVTIDSDMFSNFVFLCAQKYNGLDNGEDGILGLGPGSNYSLISQTANNSGKVFCHCLSTKSNSDSYVYFGKDAHEKCQNSGTYGYTPLKRGPLDTYYYVNLNAITIGEKRLEISPALSSSPGTIIDSGTVISHLPSSVYSALRSEFMHLMSEYTDASPPDYTLDTCYNLQGYENVSIPPMVLNFENLDVKLDQMAVTVTVKEDLTQVCLAFAKKDKEDSVTIIGNHQLRKLNVLYDIPSRRVEIGPGNC